jgi:lipopolysaccharide export system ATP-binding protein
MSLQTDTIVEAAELELREDHVARAPQLAPSPNALAASDLVKAYKRRRVVDGVSVHVEPGEVVGLLGANGAGKTTTFYVIIGLERPDAGRVRLGETMKLRRGERFKRLEELLVEFGIDHVRRTRGDALSGGERRRTEIARALVTEPQFILLDEPFAGIDPKAVDELQKMILYLRDRGIGILITDHNVRETLGVTDRAYIMADGVVFRSGKPLELTEDPEVRRLYLGEKFRL